MDHDARTDGEDITAEADDDLYGVLDHEDDDPLYGLPELGATDEEMLEMYGDKGFLDLLREGMGDITDEEFAKEVESNSRRTNLWVCSGLQIEGSLTSSAAAVATATSDSTVWVMEIFSEASQ